ncbi:MAG: DUF4838 domain-containing protein [Clostridia bacterium]|nr:DUF4838 domain-containing protein [Clostridia bacterium]
MKRILSIVLCLVMLVSVFAISASAAQYNPEVLDEDNFSITQNIMRDETYVLGDVDGDGAINAIDSLCLKATVAGAGGVVCILDAADFDADGMLTPKDSYYARACLSGKFSTTDYENGKQIYNLMIGGVSISEFSIVIPEDAAYDSNLYYATELLCDYIKDATGVTLAIERGEASGTNAIYLHHVSDDSDMGMELGHEGYIYEVTDANLHIYGTHRGCMYAAYEIIEEYLGYSFFTRDNTFSYKQRSVDIEEGTNDTAIPSYRFRHTKSTFPSGNREAGYLARKLNGSQSYSYKNEKRSLEYYGDFVGPVFNNIHSYSYYWAMGTGTMPDDDGTMTLEERYFAKYNSGELKDETKWEPCATDVNVYNTLFSGFLDTIRMIEARGYPIKYQDGTNCYSFSLNDNSNWCTCRNCSKEIRAKTGTGLYLELANKGARDIQEYYPGLDVFTWTYTREMPTNVLPDEHLVVVLSGFNCANHALGSGDCVGNTFFEHNNQTFESIIDQWSDLCDQTGAEIWLWYYPETHYWYMYDLPNIYNIYYDLKWLNEHGVTGFFYEGSGGGGYMFESLKAYLATEVMFNTQMTIEEYDQLLKDHLYEQYGEGWEYIYEFIQMYEEAGDVAGYELDGTEPHCFVGNHARAYDTTSVVYINENYEYMRGLLLSAIDAYVDGKTTNDGLRIKKLNDLFNCFEILGLGATYVDNYMNGTDEQRAEYEERYTAFLGYAKNNGMRVSSYAEFNTLPATVDLSVNPASHFLLACTWRAKIEPLLGPLE